MPNTDIQNAECGLKILKEFADIKRREGWTKSAMAMDRAISHLEIFVKRAKVEN